MKAPVGVLSAVVLLVGFVGTIAYALTVTPITDGGTIHACYDKGGKGAGRIRLVNDSTTCKNSERKVSWLAIDEVSDLNGTPCTANGEDGTVQVSFAADGQGSWVCNVPGACTANEVGLCDNTLDDDCDGNADAADEDCQGGGTFCETAPCNDGIGCTLDSCDDATQSCENTPDNAACDDGDPENGTESCDPSGSGADPVTGCVPGTPPVTP